MSTQGALAAVQEGMTIGTVATCGGERRAYLQPRGQQVPQLSPEGDRVRRTGTSR